MSDLDAEELFHLAMKASDSGDRDKTITYLKRSIELEPKAASIYVLAAEYAEIGMMRRAIEGMEQAVELDPGLWTARFQLGLLYLTQNQLQEAKNAWEPLVDLGPDAYLHHMARGMTLLMDDEATEAVQALAKGMEMNDDNPALNRDIGTIINNVQGVDEQAAAPEPVTEPESAAGEEKSSQHLFLSNYGESAES